MRRVFSQFRRLSVYTAYTKCIFVYSLTIIQNLIRLSEPERASYNTNKYGVNV